MAWRVSSRLALAVVAAAVVAGCAALRADSVMSIVTESAAAPSPYLVAASDLMTPGSAVSTTTVGGSNSGLIPVPSASPPCTGSGRTAVRESKVWVPAGDHRVPGTLALPALAGTEPIATVLMLHGDLSDRDENAGLFTREAAALAECGIGSLRIDFAGSGESEEPDLALDYPGMVADATASVRYLESDPRFDPARVAVLGMSRGGSIAATLGGTLPAVAALIEWSGAVYNGVDEDPADHDTARAQGYYSVDLGGGRTFRLSLNWFDTIEESHPLDDVAGYTGPVLAITGSADDIVAPATSDILVRTVASTDATRYSIDGAGHGFDDPSTGDESHGEQAIAFTTSWLATRVNAEYDTARMPADSPRVALSG